jgi:predicted AlkP superfamily pyrophosphatase or phosphodiesterase
MIKSIIVLFFSVIVFQVTLLAQTTNGGRYVLFIGVDGLGGYAFPKAQTPNIKALYEMGTFTFKARCVYPSSSSPNWASMIMGAKPKKTHIPKNGFSFEKAIQNSYCGRPAGQLWPSVYTLMHEQKPEKKIILLHQWDEYSRFVNPNDVYSDRCTHTEDSTTYWAIKTIEAGMPDLLFLHFDNVDHAGHTYGHNTPRYFKDVSKADSLIGLVIQALKKKGIYEQTTIILTADHGGRGKHHGWITANEMNIPWIIVGPGIRKGLHLKNKAVKTIDTGATIAFLFGLRIPECWDGKPVREVLESYVR